MNKKPTLLLKLVIYLIGIAVLALSTFIAVAVIKEGGALFLPILLIIYITVIPFLFALYQALKLLSYIDRNKALSELSVKALGKIKHSAITISALYILGMPLIVYVSDKDDAPGGIAIGLIFIFASMVIATFTAVLQKLLQEALDIKSENDLTV